METGATLLVAINPPIEFLVVVTSVGVAGDREQDKAEGTSDCYSDIAA
jgi:hypothetical protein